jgi:hypothetical protein
LKIGPIGCPETSVNLSRVTSQKSEDFNNFCVTPKRKRIQAFQSAESIVTGAVHVDMLEESDVPILEKKDPNDVLLQQ